MAIQQHSEAVGTPVRISVTGALVAILISDAQPRDRPPRPKKDASLPEGSINEIFEADEPAKKRWRHAIATYLVHEMDLRPKVAAGTQFVLDKFPSNYKLYVHLKGDKDYPRKDYYLIGSRYVRKFRSPEEFVFHAKWLAFDAPLDKKERPLCACKYCGKTDQTEIGLYLGKKVGATVHDQLRHNGCKPMRRRGEVEKPILFKDYTQLHNGQRCPDLKPDLQRIKDEEL